jgi:WXG100 family type VII secretion target
MTGTLLVTPEKLISTAESFATSANSVQTITNSMLNLVTSLANTWIGDASTAYISKFKALEEDMGQMYRMITEHSTDLQEMATNYQTAEQTISESASALNTNAIS